MTLDVQTERAKRSERYSSGKPRVKMAKEDDSPPGSPTDMPTGKTRGCYICGGVERGDAFTSLPDEKGIGRVVHIATVAVDGKSVDRNAGCLEAFTTRCATAQRQRVREEREDLALAALRREGGNIPRLEHSSQRGYDCTAEGCKRFFDTVPGRDLHLRKGHKVAQAEGG